MTRTEYTSASPYSNTVTISRSQVIQEVKEVALNLDNEFAKKGYDLAVQFSEEDERFEIIDEDANVLFYCDYDEDGQPISDLSVIAANEIILLQKAKAEFEKTGLDIWSDIETDGTEIYMDLFGFKVIVQNRMYKVFEAHRARFLFTLPELLAFATGFSRVFSGKNDRVAS